MTTDTRGIRTIIIDREHGTTITMWFWNHHQRALNWIAAH